MVQTFFQRKFVVSRITIFCLPPPVAIAGEVFVLVACVRYDVCYQYNTTRKRLHMYTVSQKNRTATISMT